MSTDDTRHITNCPFSPFGHSRLPSLSTHLMHLTVIIYIPYVSYRHYLHTLCILPSLSTYLMYLTVTTNQITYNKPCSIWRYKRDKKHKHFKQNLFHFTSEIELRPLCCATQYSLVCVCVSTLHSHKALRYFFLLMYSIQFVPASSIYS
jgi:hypothetical protein